MTKTVLVVVAVAATCHAANAAYCASLGDTSQKPWEDAPEWQRESAINGVQFHIANPDAGDAASHDNWMAMKVADGWVFGETKDEKKKTHPCIVPFDQLPPEQQFKDRLFRTIVHGFVAEAAAADREIDDAELLTAERDAAQAKAKELEGETIELTEARDAARIAATSLEKDLAEVSKQRDTLAAENAKLKKRPPVTPAPKPAKRRAAGPIEGRVDADKTWKAVTARDHVIVFSDGEEEIDALPPVQASADAWQRTGAGTMLRTPVTVAPNAKVELVGFGLFDGDTQVAWCPMAQPVAIAAGQQVKLDRQIIF